MSARTGDPVKKQLFQILHGHKIILLYTCKCVQLPIQSNFNISNILETLEIRDTGSRLLTLMIDTPGEMCEICHVAASQLPERGPTDVDVAPLPAC